MSRNEFQLGSAEGEHAHWGVKGMAGLVFLASVVPTAMSHIHEGAGWGLGLCLSVESLAEGRLHTLVTFAFFHPDATLAIYTLVSLLAFGTVMERTWGTRRFCLFVLFTALGSALGHLTYTLTADPPIPRIYGGTGIAAGLILAYLLEHQDVRLPGLMKVPVLCVPLIVVTLYLGFVLAAWKPEGQEFSQMGHLGALPAAYIAYRASNFYERFSLWWHTRQIFNELSREAETRKRVEELLEKIATSGIESLSWRERRFLREASRYYARKNPDPDRCNL